MRSAHADRSRYLLDVAFGEPHLPGEVVEFLAERARLRTATPGRRRLPPAPRGSGRS